jgi:hypothetical protein
MSVAEAVEFQPAARSRWRAVQGHAERASNALKKQGEVQKYDPEMLVRRGNYLVIITPEIAAELLERNKNNRKPKRRAIAAVRPGHAGR